MTRRKLVAYAAGACALWFAQPSMAVLVAGAVLALAGLAVRFWATGYLSKNERLTREGPYRHLRHPLYLGTWLIATGFLMAGLGSAAPLAVLVPLLVAFQIAFFGYYLPRKEAKEADRLERGFEWLSDHYRRFLELALRHRWATLGGAVASFGVAIAIAGALEGEFFPPQDNWLFFVQFDTPEGTNLETSEEYLRRNEEWILGQPELAGLFSAAGTG